MKNFVVLKLSNEGIAFFFFTLGSCYYFWETTALGAASQGGLWSSMYRTKMVLTGAVFFGACGQMWAGVHLDNTSLLVIHSVVYAIKRFYLEFGVGHRDPSTVGLGKGPTGSGLRPKIRDIICFLLILVMGFVRHSRLCASIQKAQKYNSSLPPHWTLTLGYNLWSLLGILGPSLCCWKLRVRSTS